MRSHDTEHPPLLPQYLNDKDHPFLIQRRDSLEPMEFLSKNEEETFNSLKKIMPSNWKYRTKTVLYTLNESGYRTKSWKKIDWENSIILFGCSCMFGYGVADDETIGYFLENQIKRPVINLGFIGGSNQVIIYNLSSLINKFGYPYGIGIHWTDSSRFVTFDQHSHTNYMYNSDKDKVLQRFPDRYGEIVEAYYLGQIAKSMCKNQTKLVETSWLNHVSFIKRAKFIGNDCQARDDSHPGSRVNKLIADYYFEKLK